MATDGEERFTDDQIRAGARRLRNMLPEARAKLARDGDVELKDQSPLARTTMHYVVEENFAALMIYEGPLGGFHVDLVLKETPPGTPNSIGSPVALPIPTSFQALEYAKHLLVMALSTSRANKAQPAPAPASVFWLNDIVMPLSPEVFELAATATPTYAREGWGSLEHARDKIAACIAQFAPGGCETVEQFQALPRDNQIAIMSTCHIAAMGGVFTYPVRFDAAPNYDAAGPILKSATP